MEKFYETTMREVNNRIADINLNGDNIIAESKVVIVFLKEKLFDLKRFVQFYQFGNQNEEINFFKHQKPMLLGRLIYFHKILRIESRRPICREQWDEYYSRKQEEQKFFFDRHLAFYQYYRSGTTHLDAHYFLRGKQDICHETEIYDFDYEADFSTGYDRLVSRIIAMEMLYAYLTARRKSLLNTDDNTVKLIKENRWTGKIVDLVELIYALDTSDCINSGKTNIEDIVHYVSLVFNIEIKNCFNTYVDMKKRKGESRTYFLDELARRLNERMDKDDEK